MTVSKHSFNSESQSLLAAPQSAPPPYSEHPTTTTSSTAPIPSQLPPRPPPSHALGPTPVSALPAAPPALWHAHVPSSYRARPHARADARARRRFCAAFVCAWIVWLVAALVLGAVVGEEIVRRSEGDARGGGGRYAVRLWGVRAGRGGEERAASDEGEWVVVHETDESTPATARRVLPPRSDFAAI